ncbi:MAG: hypothetical protein M1568_00240 [Acidobacteria bacterium]|jgi:hypothetical protein|nr:hypothetical protein [Acidobacteriota bacterium]
MTSQIRTRLETAPHQLKSNLGFQDRPNSSAIASITTLANSEEVLASLRTFTLLGRSFRTQVSIFLFGDPPITLEPEPQLPPQAVEKLLRSIKSKLVNRQLSSGAQLFSIEVSLMAASFLIIDTVSLRIRHAESILKHPPVTR